MDVITDNANDLLRDITLLCMEDGITVNGTTELLATQTILTDVKKNFASVRNMSPYYAVGELCWYLSGSNKLDFISYYSKFWEKISDNNLTCNSAYGYCMTEQFGFDQIKEVADKLNKNPNTRQAVIQIKDPNIRESKDIPCTVFLQFFIRENYLHLITNMRSNDLYLGLPYDLFCFTEIQKYVLTLLEDKSITLGCYIHNSGSTHIYDRDKNKIEKLLNNTSITPEYFFRNKDRIPEENYVDLVKLERIIREDSPSAALELIENISKGTFEEELHEDIIGMVLVLCMYKLKVRDIEIPSSIGKIENVWLKRVLDYEK